MNIYWQKCRIGVFSVALATGAGNLIAAGDVSDVNAVPHLKEKGREGYTRFLTVEHARAFALAEGGAWGSGSKRESRTRAVAVAMYNCNKAARNVCRAYAVNNDVVYQRYAVFEQKSATMLESMKKETFRFSEYGDELRDFGVASPETLRKDDYHADTPLSLNGVRTIKTVDLVKMMTSQTPPILIDALEGDGHDTIPGTYWIKGAGMYGKSEDVNAEIRDRLGFVLAGLMKGNKAAPIVFFCLDLRCWLSYNSALRARELGYTNVYWYRGGLKAWQAARLDTLEAVQYGQVW